MIHARATRLRFSHVTSSCSRSARASGSKSGWLELAAQRIQLSELLRRDVLLGKLAFGQQQRAKLHFEANDRAARGRRRIVDLMRNAGGKRAQSDQRLR